MKCAGCKNRKTKKKYLQCSACKESYDTDCANISQTEYDLMERKDLWRCPECVNKRSKTGNIITPVRNVAATICRDTESCEVAAIKDTKFENSNITQRIKSREPPPSSVRDSSDTEKILYSEIRHNDLLDNLKSLLSEMFETHMTGIREAIDGLASALTAQNTRLEQLEDRVAKLENKPQEVQQLDTIKIESVVSQLQADIVERDQVQLINDLEITGCTETPNENRVHLTIAVAKKIGIELDEKDIVSAERAGPAKRTIGNDASPPARPRPLAVRLTRRALRDSMLQAARARRTLSTEGLELPGPVGPLYINERLSKHNRLLFQKARLLGRDLNFKFIWTREGKIYARKEQGKPRYRLRTEEDLHSVFGKSVI